ncbi:hypothetical protein ACFYPT_38890 [Streptomyces sp. NPDC005529]|uniref:hypothetical protein n=1 Tax=unclassified Streptomyces TaxID=2593676 RepID=UPI0033A2D989
MKNFQAQSGSAVQAYHFALDSNADQEVALALWWGACRLQLSGRLGQASWWQRRAEESYGIGEDLLANWRPWSLPSLRKPFNEAKHITPGSAVGGRTTRRRRTPPLSRTPQPRSTSRVV